MRPTVLARSPSPSTLAAFGLALALAAALPACTDDGGPPADPPDPEPSALARCADPAVALTTGWEVDNLHAPITSIARTGDTLIVASGDGALKTWHLRADGAAELRPTYGTPIVDRGVALAALATAADGTVAAVDAEGRARTWTGGEPGAPLALLPAAGVAVALDDDARWLAGATAGHAGDLTLADLATGAVSGPLATDLWHAAAAAISGDRWVTVGDWYGCHAIDVRSPDDPASFASWDACRDLPADQHPGWFRAVAVDPTGTHALAVGDTLLARFALADLAAGPAARATTDVPLHRVVLLPADRLAITLATRGAASELTWWSLDDLAPLRTATIPASIDLALHPAAGLLVTASPDGLLRSHTCAD